MQTALQLSTNDVRGGVHDEAGLDAARAWLERLVRAEIAQGLEPQNILLGKFRPHHIVLSTVIEKCPSCLTIHIH